MNSREIEIAVARHFGFRQNIIVPNVWWGLRLNHEADILVVSESGYAREIEIKVTASDIKADLKKRHGHTDMHDRIRQVYFAVPEKLKDNPNIPQEFGLISVSQPADVSKICYVSLIRPAKINRYAKPLKETEIRHLLHMGCMRIWSLKEKLNKLKGGKS